MEQEPAVDVQLNRLSDDLVTAFDQNAPLQEFQVLLRQSKGLGDADGVLDMLHYRATFAIKRSARMDVLMAFLLYYPALVSHKRRDTGRFLLHLACRFVHDSTEVVELLLDLYPDAVHREDLSGHLPFHYACIHGSIQLIELFLSRYPTLADSPCHASRYGASDGTPAFPLHLALHGQQTPRRVISKILRLYPGAARDTVAGGDVALHMACSFLPRRSDNIKDLMQLVRRLVEIYPAGLRARNSKGELPLQIGCRYLPRSHDLVKYLLEEYPDGAKIQSNDLSYPLQDACFCNGVSPEIFELLVELFPDAVSAPNSAGRLPLHTLAMSSAPPSAVVQLLICNYQGPPSDYGGLNVRDINGKVPLHYLCVMECPTKTMQLVLNHFPGAVQVRDENGFLPLHTMCDVGGARTIEPFRHLVDMNLCAVVAENARGATPAMLASQENRPHFASRDVISFLVRKQNEAVGNIRVAVAHVAARKGLPDLAAALVWTFAKPDLRQT